MMRPTRSSRLTKAAMAAVVAAGLLTSIAGPLAAAPPELGGSSASSEEVNRCRLAYEIMQWAKTKRQKDGDFYDWLANAAFNYIDTRCRDIDFLPPSTEYQPGDLSPEAESVVEQFSETGVFVIEPVDDPLPVAHVFSGAVVAEATMAPGR